MRTCSVMGLNRRTAVRRTSDAYASQAYAHHNKKGPPPEVAPGSQAAALTP